MELLEILPPKPGGQSSRASDYQLYEFIGHVIESIFHENPHYSDEYVRSVSTTNYMVERIEKLELPTAHIKEMQTAIRILMQDKEFRVLILKGYVLALDHTGTITNEHLLAYKSCVEEIFEALIRFTGRHKKSIKETISWDIWGRALVRMMRLHNDDRMKDLRKYFKEKEVEDKFIVTFLFDIEPDSQEELSRLSGLSAKELNEAYLKLNKIRATQIQFFTADNKPLVSQGSAISLYRMPAGLLVELFRQSWRIIKTGLKTCVWKMSITFDGKSNSATWGIKPTHYKMREDSKRVPYEAEEVAEDNLSDVQAFAKKFGTAQKIRYPEDGHIDRLLPIFDYLKYQKFRRSYLHEISVFGDWLTEMQYLAIVAEYFKSFEQDIPVMFPEIVDKERKEFFAVQMRTAALLRTKDAHDIVPNDVHIGVNSKRLVGLITGPNNNGKTEYMNGIGVWQVVFQDGWPILAEEARISPRDNVLAHYVHGGMDAVGESRFKHECSRMRKEVLEMITPYSLILLDEIGTGTNVEHATEWLADVLEIFSKEEITVLLASHFHGLIDHVEALSYGFNIHCQYNENEKGGYTYHIADGSSRKSNVSSILSETGVDKKSIEDFFFYQKHGEPF